VEGVEKQGEKKYNIFSFAGKSMKNSRYPWEIGG